MRKLLLFGLALVASTSSLHAQKTDIVVLDNGDRITGEIKELELGRLRYKTDAASTLYLEWEHVRTLTSDKTLEIEVESGVRYYGSVGPAEREGELRITQADPDGTINVPLLEIVHIRPIEASFWSRLEGLLALGLDVAKANRARSLTFEGELEYRGRQVELELRGDSYFQEQEGAESTTSNHASLRGFWFLGDRWFMGGQVGVEQNDELNLDLRGTLTVGGGRVLFQTNRIDWLVMAGLAGSRETFAELDAETILEGVAATDFKWFLFGDNETELSVRYTLFPGLSGADRVRFELDTRFKRDLFLDFFVALEFSDDFNSNPPDATDATVTEDPTKNDYRLTFTLGYDF